MAKNNRYRKKVQWFPVHLDWSNSPAYYDLKAAERSLLFELCKRKSKNNNGKIKLSVREAVELVGATGNTISKAFHSLKNHGFIKMSKSSNLIERTAREWTLTMFEVGIRRPTDDWVLWKKLEQDDVKVK